MRSLHSAGLMVALALAAQAGFTQEILLPKAEGPVAVNGPWVITNGDGQPGAQAAANASAWHPIGAYSPPTSWPAQPEILWLRATMRIDDPPPRPALLIAPTADGCQIFINGVEAGNCSGLSAPNDSVQRGILVHLPGQLVRAPLAVAIRLYHPSYTPYEGSLGLGPGDVLYGSASALADYRTARDAAHFYQALPQALLCVAELIGGTILLVVFGLDRRNSQYAWFAAFLLLDGTCSLLSVFYGVYPLQGPLAHNASDFIGLIIRYVPLISFLAAFTGVRVSRWVRAYQWLLLALPFVGIMNLKGAELGLWRPWSLSEAFFLASQIPFVAGSLIFLVIQWRRGNKEAALLLPSFLLANGIEVLGLTVPFFQHRFHWGRFGFNYDDLSMLFFLVSIGPVMLFRHRRISLDHARATAELDAAREIQQRLVPAMLPAVPGFELSAQYLPAAEVGGDFYQVLKQTNGSALIVVGDVSGKGLKAAMTGVLAIGALRTLAAEDLKPAALLQRLNHQMVGGQNGGFVTCICASLHGDLLTVANAGHLAPYRNGEEMVLEAGLPLGIAEDSCYPETAVRLAPGDRLTVLSDGVVEARSKSGELFGFERTAAISTGTAENIARAAQHFGQEDDITVLTLTFIPAPNLVRAIYA
jgi:phosphoserine phosphatase RsbU/P